MAASTTIILNPLDASGPLRQRRLELCLRGLGPIDLAQAADAREAEEAAWQAAQHGCGKLIAAGGSEMAAGLVNAVMRLAPGHRRAIKVGFLALGGPCEFSRTIGFPQPLERQLEVLRAGHTLPYDLGRVDCLDFEGRPVSRHFLNGVWLTDDRPRPAPAADRLPQALVALLALGHGLRALLHGPPPQVLIEGETGSLYRGPLRVGAVMGGRFYPRRGELAPHADPLDGAMDVVWAGAGAWLRLARLLYAPILPGPAPRAAARVGRLRISSLSGTVYLECDGVPLGMAPATFSVESRALPVIVEPVAIRIAERQRALLADLPAGQLAGNLKTASSR
ncbi:MAG: hypothetical protein HY423_04485 [Candidatus Lambdaproteobacteria bacterium]|nr:hypothetical protein [Candidatus Lambdaproteobacteria bacterium]